MLTPPPRLHANGPRVTSMPGPPSGLVVNAFLANRNLFDLTVAESVTRHC